MLDACRSVGVEKIYVIVGFGADQVKERFCGDEDKDIVWVHQANSWAPHTPSCAVREHLENFAARRSCCAATAPDPGQDPPDADRKHEAEQSAATLATAVLDDPTGYGRIIRDVYGNIQGIVEDSDCTPTQRAVKEVNPSYYLFNNQALFKALSQVKPNNVKQEYYLTDALSVLIATGNKVVAVTAVRPEEAMGVNSRTQLSVASKIMQHRVQQELMENGVTIVDPENTWIDARAKIGQDTVIEPFVYIHGAVSIGRDCRIGPFAFLREGTVIGDDVVLGVFTEVKNTSLADGVRARHHSYLGDAAIGCRVNVGAGSITANYDGHHVHRTSVGDDCNIGSGAVLIAPLTLPAGANVGAGTVVSQENVDKLCAK